MAGNSGKIETSTVLSATALAMTLVLAVLKFSGENDEKISALEKRVCRAEAAIKMGDCAR